MYEHVIVHSKSPDQMSQRFLNNGSQLLSLSEVVPGHWESVPFIFGGGFRGFTEPLAGSWYNQVKVETLEERSNEHLCVWHRKNYVVKIFYLRRQ